MGEEKIMLTVKEKNHQYYLKHCEQERVKARRYYWEHREQKLAYAKNHTQEHKAKVQVIRRLSDKKMKQEVLAHYSISNPPVCIHCGMTDMDVLTIDHTNGGGSKHRREIGKGGVSFHRWLKMQGYPKGYQTLCANCNLKKLVVKRERMREVFVEGN